MTSAERAFLMLSSNLGDTERIPLTTMQLRVLAQRAYLLSDAAEDADLDASHLRQLGLDTNLTGKILQLLKDDSLLDRYLTKAKRSGCIPICRSNADYPLILRKRLGYDAPGCLWTKGNLDILKLPAVSLVGSRDLRWKNRDFARAVGWQAAKQGFVLVSGNARGADITAQNACLEAGGNVISVVADSLLEHTVKENVLYISENDYDAAFSSLRALRRNHTIHALGEIVFAAQCTYGKGGTWDGSVENLKNMWSPLFCYQDGTEASAELGRIGASLISIEDLKDFYLLANSQSNLF